MEKCWILESCELCILFLLWSWHIFEASFFLYLGGKVLCKMACICEVCNITQVNPGDRCLHQWPALPNWQQCDFRQMDTNSAFCVRSSCQNRLIEYCITLFCSSILFCVRRNYTCINKQEKTLTAFLKIHFKLNKN